MSDMSSKLKQVEQTRMRNEHRERNLAAFLNRQKMN
jgi:hypothetical protein